MPVSALPSVDITADAITFEGKHVAGVKSIMAETTTSAQIPELADAVSKKSKQAIAATAPPVALHGPVIVKPLDATPMQLVWRVLMSVVSAGDDVVLASEHAGTWTLLSPIAFPVVPVPLATGAPWHQLKLASLASLDEDERVVLSVLVTKDKVWVGLSRVNEFTEFDRGPDLEKKLLENLQQQKQSAFFADRTDIEIAGDDDVTYGDVVHVLHTVNTAGFTDWRLSHPQRLAARPDLQ
jgi:biopolymer transport protein ExbD